MKISKVLFSMVTLVILTSFIVGQAGNFGTSLHNNRQGKSYWYDAEQGGFFATTSVPIEDMGCKDCHGSTDANGVAWDDNNPYPGAGSAPCYDCHADNNFSADGVSQDQCLSCHSRQN
ncbi:MAG: cytochrome c3 family protein, partial [Ignavibacteria bacterium]